MTFHATHVYFAHANSREVLCLDTCADVYRVQCVLAGVTFKLCDSIA